MVRKLIFDAWTPMSFKRVLGNRTQPGHSYESPKWVGDHDRRLMAYKVLQAYTDNAAREFLATTDEQKIEAHREYGDAALIRDTILAALLGQEQEIVVDGAQEGEQDEENTDSTATEDADAAAKLELQDWLREQWDLERGTLKVQETERDAVGLGDGVYSLGWSGKKGRARIRVWDPGFYFPVLTDGNEDDYPDKVHIAWEIPEADRKDKNKLEIRRITYELRELPDGGTQNLPWNDEPTNLTCYYTDALFQLDSTGGKSTVMDLERSSAIFQLDEDGEPLDEVDMGLDFVPVVHVPNTVAIKNHYGRSSLSTVLQVLDDLANTDTDLQAASATAARPVIALSGGSLGKKSPEYRPGEVWEVGDGGMAVLDTATSLDALLKYVEFLLGRLSVSARTPDALLGRVDPSKVDAGIVLALSFGPLAAMVAEMRLSRNEKYPLLLKFLWRINIANGAEDVPANWFPAELAFGSYLPQDKAAISTQVQELLTAKGISLETAIAMLMAAGFPIEDALEEVKRIQGRDFAGAVQLRDAMDSDSTVAEYLGIEVPSDKVEPPEIVPPDPNNPDAPAAPGAPAQPPAPAPPQ